jgi:hypothetical protein
MPYLSPNGTTLIFFLFLYVRGRFVLGWNVDDPSATDRNLPPGEGRTIEIVLTANEKMGGPGFIGIGWGKQEMKGAEIWFCRVDSEAFDDSQSNKCTSIESDQPDSSDDTSKPMFTCCVAPGGLHRIDGCAGLDDDVFYELELVNWCLSPESSSITVRAPVCSIQDDPSDPQRNCFRLSSTSEGNMDFIVAHNPDAQDRPHGFQRRTAAQVNLIAGILTQTETQIADTGLIATHGVFMLVSWMLCAPWSIFVSCLDESFSESALLTYFCSRRSPAT